MSKINLKGPGIILFLPWKVKKSQCNLKWQKAYEPCIMTSVLICNVSNIYFNWTKLIAAVSILITPVYSFHHSVGPLCRGRSHKVGPAAKVGPYPFAVVHNGTTLE